MRIFLFMLFFFCTTALFADDFTPEQQSRIRQTVKSYCDNLAAFCNDTHNMDAHNQIMQLVANRFGKMYDDLSPTYAELDFYQYLNKIKKEYKGKNLKITFSPEIEKAEIKGFFVGESVIAQIILEKKIICEQLIKKTANYIYVDLTDSCKILNIGDKTPIIIDMNSTSLQKWQKTIETLTNRNWSYLETYEQMNDINLIGGKRSRKYEREDKELIKKIQFKKDGTGTIKINSKSRLFVWKLLKNNEKERYDTIFKTPKNNNQIIEIQMENTDKICYSIYKLTDTSIAFQKQSRFDLELDVYELK